MIPTYQAFYYLSLSEREEERVVRDKREIVCTAQKGDGVGLHSSIISMNKIKKDFQEKILSLLLTHSHNYYFFCMKMIARGSFLWCKISDAKRSHTQGDDLKISPSMNRSSEKS